jgi:signal peptidase I
VASPNLRSAAGVAPRRAPARTKPKNEALEWIKSIGVAVGLFLLIRTFLVQAYSIPSESMERTLLVGDYLMANNAIFGARLPLVDVGLPALRDPRNGEVVVFRPTYNDPVIDVVKRVVGTPGDTLQMRDKVLFRNGRPVSESYARYEADLPDQPLEAQMPEAPTWHRQALAPGTDAATYRPSRNNWGPLVVPPGHYFLMGDNRDHSLDSRFMGFIPRDVIRGKPLFLYYSFDKQSDAAAPFFTEVRWGRIGSLIRTHPGTPR